MTGAIRVGDRVRLTQMPPQVEAMRDDNDELHTKIVFQQCVGHVFRVRGIGTNNQYGETDHVELWVRQGEDWDNDDGGAEYIWVEQVYAEVVTDEA